MLMIENVYDTNEKKQCITLSKLMVKTGKTKYKLEKFIDSNLLIDGKYKVTSVSKSNINIPDSTLREWDVITERFRRYYANKKKKIL